MRTIVITGASAGIGAAIARRLGRDGNRLVLAARRGELLQQVARESGDAVAVVADVTRRENVEHLRDEALRAFGAVDVWINNAGRGISRLVLDLTSDDFDEMMRVNVKSALYGMQVIVPYFADRGRGHLINISSVLGRVPTIAPHRSAYNAAKAALNALTANLRADVAGKGVDVSLFIPGRVLTDFPHNVLGAPSAAPPPRPPGTRAQPQTPEQVADAMAELIKHPRPEFYTNRRRGEMVRRWFEKFLR
ncbi:MAG: SDR family oxidoreductase [Acidobacteria bacterium]|nr:SDR family oxidoreductase [Acidobacteriota bacterium]MBV9068142.1 SDR family oxidoreductase [Acidobacteriota bacterium]MBV9186404.1 SDR family oxidoreductase [Acidobacteriota bacterium]